MKQPLQDPPRWREHREQSDRAEQTIGQDLRAIKTPAPLAGAQIARIAAGLRRPSRPRASLRWLVVAASLILGVATAASAARLHLLPRWLTGASAPLPAPPPGPRSKPHHGRPHVPEVGQVSRRETTPEPTAPAPSAIQTQNTLEPPATATPAPRQGDLLAPSPRRAPHRDMSPASSAPAPGPSPMPPRPAERTESSPATAPADLSPPRPPFPSEDGARPRVPQVAMLDAPRSLPGRATHESPKDVDDAEISKLLAQAIRLLRAEGHPQSALVLLDQQETRLNQSPYRHEALLVRVEALLALKREAELLRLLDGMSLAEVAASRTLLTTRGRLRAAARRCAEAVMDFDRALAEPGRKDKQALLGRALCREALGDREGAQADRERYRQESLTGP